MEIMGLNIELKSHASIKIKKENMVIYIDPFDVASHSLLEKADLILITHPHYDHCSPKDIEKVVKDELKVLFLLSLLKLLNSKISLLLLFQLTMKIKIFILKKMIGLAT